MCVYARFLCAVIPTRVRIVRRITYGRQSQKSLAPRGRRPPPSELLQHRYTYFLTFLLVPRQPSPTRSPSPTSPAYLLSSPRTPQPHPRQRHQMKCSLPPRHRPSPPSRPRTSTPGRKSTRLRSPSGAGKARQCARAPRWSVHDGRNVGRTSSSSRRNTQAKTYDSDKTRIPPTPAHHARAIGRPSRTGAARTHPSLHLHPHHHRPWRPHR